MKCPLCQVEMRIFRSRNVVENDDTPDVQTKLFILQDMSCRNENCENYEKIVLTVKTELPIG